MKLARLVCTALALTVTLGWAAGSTACDYSKATAAAASKAHDGTPAMAALCTPEMMAACKASIAAGGPDLCRGGKTAAVTAASHACGVKAGQAAAVVAKGSCGTKGTTAAVTAADAEHCATAKASRVAAAAQRGGGAAAVAAGSACGTKGAKASTAAQGYSKGAIVAAGAGQCAGHGIATMAALGVHDDCEACLDMADCNGALDEAGANRQVVRLKNGIMYVYTADSPRSVSAVQAAVARRAERLVRFTTGEKARLCAACKEMRGAMASGKLNREVVNIEGGTLTLITSSDRGVVAKIHALSGEKVPGRTKS